MCNPQLAHTGAGCDQTSWTSWAVVVVLALVILYSIHVLHAAAKRGVSSSTKSWSGFTELAYISFGLKRDNDSGSAAMRAVIGVAVLQSASHVWKILSAAGVISDRTSGYWDEMLFFPLAEGSYMLPASIVISVWMDVANSSMSRVKARRKLRTTKTALEISAVSYVLFLMVACVSDHHYLAMVMNLSALGIGMFACGSGSAKLCKTLRKTGGNNVEIATKVFQVSRSMGMNFYAMFVGNAMLLSSHTRKSNPANLALVGLAISAISKCFLNKVIFEYACDSARAKRERTAHAKRDRRQSVKPVAGMVLTVQSLHNSVKHKGPLPPLQLKCSTITPVEEDPREYESDNINHGNVAVDPFFPVLESPGQSCDEAESKVETTTSHLRGPHRNDAERKAGKGGESDDETGSGHAPIGLPGLVRVGRRISSSLRIPNAPSEGGDETGSNAWVSQSRLSMLPGAETSECKGKVSED